MFRKPAFVLALVFVLCVSAAAGQTSNAQDWMPDANLRAAVRETLGLDDGEVLEPKDMELLDGLYIQNRKILDVTGLEFAVNLKGIIMFNNPITNLRPIANLKLIDLNAGGCRITDISPLKNMVRTYAII